MSAKLKKRGKKNGKRINISGGKPKKLSFNIENHNRFLPYLVFIVSVLIFFREQIFGSSYFWASFMSDFNEIHIPYMTFAIENIKSFHIPFWNPYVFGGMPFLSDIQLGFFYPFNFFLFLFVKSGELPVRALEYQIMFHFLIAQISMYLLARELKISVIGSIISALSFSFSGILVYRIIIQTFIYQIVWLPLIFLLFYKISRELKLKYALFAGLLLGMLLLTGHPQAFFYNSLIIIFFIVYTTVQQMFNKESGKSNVLKLLFLSLIPFIIAIGISAIQLFHTYELAALSKRTLLTLKEAADGSLQLKQLFTAFVPKLYGSSDMMRNHIPFYLVNKGYLYWESGFYFGIAAIVLAIIGWIRNLKSPLGIFMLIIAAFGLLYAMGINGFLFQLLFYLPVFDKFRFPVRTMYYLVFAFTLFAGYGYDYVKNSVNEKDRKLIFVSVSVPLVISLVIYSGIFSAFFGTPDKFMPQIKRYAITALFISIIIDAIIILLSLKKFNSSILGSLLIIMIIFDLTYNLGSFKNSDKGPRQVYKIDSRLKKLLKAKPPDDIYRVKMRNKFVLPMQRNSGLIHKIMFIEGFGALQLIKKMPIGKHSLDLLSVKYKIETDLTKGQSYFKPNINYFAHSRMTYKTIKAKENNLVEIMKHNDIDYKNTAIIEKDLSKTLPQKDVDSVKNKVQCLVYTADYQKYEIETDETGLLNVSEVWYPAWRSKIDGVRTEIYRINYCLRGVEIPPGKHIVEFYYKSKYFFWGMIVTIFTLLFVTLLLLAINRLQKIK